MSFRVALASLAWLGALGCEPSAVEPVTPRPPTDAEWQASLARLDELRREQPQQPYGMVVQVTLKEPRTGRSFAARGGLAVDPHRALRMILLGPGGSTALDAWVTPDAYRFEIPPLGLRRRGGEPADASLPVAFFRWWFLGPVDGRLLASYAGSDLTLPKLPACAGRWFLLRRGPSTVTLCDPRLDGPLQDVAASERTPTKDDGTRVEWLAFRGQGLSPHPGDGADYTDTRSGVRAHVEVESCDTEPPDPIAFLDPDQGGAR